MTPAGRIVLAGSVQAGKHKRQTAALMQLLPDGRPDPSFGKGGLVTMPVHGKGLFTALAIGSDGAITVGGRHLVGNHFSGLVACFSAAGSPDRPLIRRAARTSGVAAEAASSPVRVLLWGRRIVMVPRYFPSALVYATNGAFERALVFGKTRRPATYLGGAALQGKNLVIVLKTAHHHTFKLTRLLP